MLQNRDVGFFVSHLGELSYLGSFIAGIFFAFGFTAPFSAAFFLEAIPKNIFIAAVFGGLGALISDLIIFRFIRVSFRDEFEGVRKEWAVRRLNGFAGKILGKKLLSYLSFAFAFILIASPLPDEAGVVLLAGLTDLKARDLAIIGFVCNTLGILFLLAV